MKLSIAVILLFCIQCFILLSETDTLVINLKNNGIQKIPLSQINKIQFENLTSIIDEDNRIKLLQVTGNKPNPFSESTEIEFEIQNPGMVNIHIYDNAGQFIRTLDCDNCPSGKNSLNWDCLDSKGIRVKSGVYYYDVIYNNNVQSRKMILVH